MTASSERHPFSRLLRATRTAAAVSLAGMLAACASLSPPPEVTVQQRAQARWNSLIGGQFEKAYGYAAPSYRRVTTPERFRAGIGNGGAWQAADVHDVTCTAERCEVKIRVQVKLPMYGIRPVQTDTKEIWIKENGQWWLYQAP